MDRVRKMSRDMEAELIAVRRDIHMHPELGYNEERTSALIAERLGEFCDTVRTNAGGYGVVGVIHGSGKGPVIALRADMDALPVEEENGCGYRSRVPGVMHACGHDAHTAILLGAARLLSQLRDDFAGTVKCIFQPAEECLPKGGAKAMVDAGVLEDPAVGAMLALHVTPLLEYGELSIPRTAVMAGGDVFRAQLRGRGTHGAIPHAGIDSILMAAQAITGIQNIVSRMLDAREQGIVSVCGIKSSSYSYNVMPESVELQGTVRYTNPALSNFFQERIEQVLAGVGKQFGGEYVLDYHAGYPPTINDRALADRVAGWAEAMLGEGKVLRSEKPMMTSEDVSRYFEKVPGCYMWIGAKPQGRDTQLHSASFDLDERVLALGSALLANSSIHYLREEANSVRREEF